MCFIIAKIGGEGFMTDSDRKDLIALFKEAEVSGGQGRGFYGIKQGIFKTMKGIKKSKKILLKAFEKNKSIVYHTRFATQGNISLQNSHPFSVFGKKHNLVGVHNGNLYGDYSYNYSGKTKKARKSVECDKTDSQLFFEYLADNGIDKAFKKYYDSGWGAFVWYDLDVKKWYALKLNGNLEGSITDFGLVVATNHLWDKFYSGRSIDLDDLTLYELYFDKVKPIKVFKSPIKKYNFERFGRDSNNECSRYGHYEDDKWVCDDDCYDYEHDVVLPYRSYGDEGKMSSYEAGKKIRRRLEREAEEDRILDDIDEDISLAKKVKKEMEVKNLIACCVGGKVFVKDEETGEIKQEVIDTDGNAYLLPLPNS